MLKKITEVCDQKTVVNKETARFLQREKWREQQRRYRSWRCRDGKGVVCRKNCNSCSYYLNGGLPTGNALSLEGLLSDEKIMFDPVDKNTDIEEETAQRILKEDIMKARDKLSEKDKVILDCVLEEYSDSQIAIKLGITKSGAREARYRLFSRLQLLLKNYSDYFQEI